MLSKNFILYSIIGFSCLIVEIIAFRIFIEFKINIFISNILSIYLASIISFTLNGIYNFKKFNNKLKRYMLFISIIILGSLLSSVLLKVFSLFLTVMVAKIFTIPFVVIFQYLLNKNFTFKLEFNEN